MVDITNDDIDEMEAEHNALFTDPHKQWQFDEVRRNVIRLWEDVQACPGSGKTTLVAAKLLILSKKWTETHKGICVLTHTNVARDEIVERLHDHPSGFKLTAYPHFIGTIQEFVNRFLGLPYVRTEFEFKRFIEGTEGHLEIRRAQIDGYRIDEICRNLYGVCNRADYEIIKDYLGSLHFTNGEGDLRFFKQNGSEENCLHTSNSDRRRMLEALKHALCMSGLFQFRDMYAFAETLVAENPNSLQAIRNRFPLIIMDEMQDTQEFQDRIIRQLFDHDSASLQRLGDPDQAIYDGIGGDEPNTSYNDKEGLYEIKSTHRFGSDICEKIIGLSYNQLEDLSSVRNPERGEHPHTIFLYDDASREKVLEAFGDLVAQADPDGNWKTVKAAGGVEGEGGHISKYWPKFDRNKSSSNPKPKKLIHIAHICKEQSKGHVALNYGLLMQGVLDLLRKAERKTTNKDGRDVYFSRPSLNAWLREKTKRDEFRKILTSLMLDANLSEGGWARHVADLTAILEIPELSPAANEYLEHDAAPEGEDHTPSTNVYTCANEREIEVGTIHSVKGETHDATLILETKLRTNDVEQMLPFFIDGSLARPTTEYKKAFMRKLYVAASRPRHLLCIAMHEDHINPEQIGQLTALGWSVPPPLGAEEGDR